VQRLRRLLRQRSVRRAEGVFVLEGARGLGEALTTGAAIEAIYVAPGAESGEAPRRVLALAQQNGVRIFALQAGVLERVADTVAPQPVLAVIAAVDVPLAAVLTPASRRGPLVVCADVRDPGNVGAIIRSADAAGARGVIVCAGSGDLYNPKTVRASAGSLFHVPIVLGDDAVATLDELGRQGVARYAAVATGGEDYATTSYPGAVAVVLGNEAHGLSPELLARCDAPLTIPIDGGAESLNVAMAATVLCFEFARRARAPEPTRPTP
jgi:TrmH family RNA methyltransferase